MKNFKIYKGPGKLGDFKVDDFKLNPRNYIPSKGLINAVNVAIATGQPLLLTGEPGTGKSHLAYSVAFELDLGEPLVFRTKTTSISRDLFYSYDALSHFRKTQTDTNTHISQFIRDGALGKAIKSDSRRVVLIDEIDKAPRDLPNDILNEIESLSYEVLETGEFFEADPKNRPIVIMTSNSEKNLPDAFLRRCVFYHVPFPTAEELAEIVKSRVQSHYFDDDEIDQIIQKFLKLKKDTKRKPPATAELIDWVKILEELEFKEGGSPITFEALSKNQKDILMVSYSLLAKTAEDLQILRKQQS